MGEKDYVNQKLNFKKIWEGKRLKKFIFLINEIKVLIIIKKRRVRTNKNKRVNRKKLGDEKTSAE